MALPYLVIGAFPSLVRWLPKPGAWMETVKQLMGFVLLATVVYLFWAINAELLRADAGPDRWACGSGCGSSAACPSMRALGKQVAGVGRGLPAAALLG